VLDVLVHVDAEDDSQPESRSASLPGRTELTDELARLLGPGVTQAQKPLLHYIGNRVEAEVFLSHTHCFERERLSELNMRLRTALTDHPHFRAIAIHCRAAPQ
jgi:hypothetical protein